MTRAQFLNELYRRLGSMSREQAEQHLTYYAEMLMDRMEEGMSEEEAVASMEDVDTIARRILQEEGQAPTAPDPAPRAAEPRTAAAAVPEPTARNWQKIAKIGLWTAAVVAVVWVVAGKLHTSGRATDVGTPSTEVDASEVPVDTSNGIRIGPNGLEINDGGDSIRMGPNGVEINGGDWEDWTGWSEWSDWEDWAWSDLAGYDGSYDDYPGESYSLSASGIKDIEVDWVAGVVEIQPGGDNTIYFSESSSKELTDETKMVYEVDGDTLHIRFCRNTNKAHIDYGKRLLLTVPEGLVEDLEVTSSSADVWVGSLRMEDLDINTTSGMMWLGGVTAKSLDLGTTSGGVTFDNVESGKVKVSSTSGDVSGFLRSREVKVTASSGNISLYGEDGGKYELETTSGDMMLNILSASELELESSSGDIVLLLPNTMGFTLEYETSSGDFYSGDEFTLAHRNGKYICGNGGCKIEVETTSGDLTLSMN